jgi:hypothetical protein
VQEPGIRCLSYPSSSRRKSAEQLTCKICRTILCLHSVRATTISCGLNVIAQRTFSIGGISVAVRSDPGKADVIVDSALCSFEREPAQEQRPDIVFSASGPAAVALGGNIACFSTLPDGLWKMWKSRSHEGYLVTLHDLFRGERPYRFATADRIFSDVIVRNAEGYSMAVNPLAYPLGELVISAHLNINRIGVLLHSALISLDGQGYLFSGTSGAGKSTLSELWTATGGAEVLTDERVVIREKDGALWAFGTPWHGTAGIHRNKGNAIGGIFFLRHGARNEVKSLSRIDAANRLMVRCFPTFWHEEGMRFALDFCSRIAGEVACYEFGFVPDVNRANFVDKSPFF